MFLVCLFACCLVKRDEGISKADYGPQSRCDGSY